MKYKKVTVSKDYPLLGEKLGYFLYLFCNLDNYAVGISNGVVIDGPCTPETFYAQYSLLGWTWDAEVMMKIRHDHQAPDPAFVKFVYEFMTMIGFIKYEDTPEHHQAYNLAMGNLKAEDGPITPYHAWRHGRSVGLSKDE